MSSNINIFNGDDNKKGLERTGRVGGQKKSVNQYELDETQIMVAKPTVNSSLLGIKLNLD